MSFQIPSVSALKTFEAAARHMSFTKAADELGVTQGAVSRQMALLEEYLGLLLFQRVRKRLVLTEAGEQYARSVRAALQEIESATMALLAHKGKGGALTIAVAPAFATKWLIPRLARFHQAYPGIFVNLHTRDVPFDLERESFDAAFHYGNNDWPNVISEPLVGWELAVVCSPGYLAKHPRLQQPEDLQNHLLLHQTRRPNRWREWFDAMGIGHLKVGPGASFEHFYMIAQGAVADLGVALVPRLLVEDDIMAGRLVAPLSKAHFSADAYCLVYPASKRNDPRLEQFRRWLLTEATPQRHGHDEPA